MEPNSLLPILAGFVTVIGGVAAKWLEHRQKLLSEEIKVEGELRAQLLGRIERLELERIVTSKQNSELLARVQHLETQLASKDLALQKLVWDHNDLLRRHDELAERCKVAEAESKRLKDELLSHYMASSPERKTVPPPPPREPWPKSIKEAK